MRMNKEDKKTAKLLAKLAKESKPSKQFQRDLLNKLKEQHKAKHPSDYSFWFKILKFKAQVGGAFAVLALFTSTTIYAYNSPRVTNGHILYPVKTTIEEIEENFADTPEEKSAFYNKMALRRIEEIETLEGKDIIDETTIIAAQTYLEKAKKEAVIVSLDSTQEAKIKEMMETIKSTESTTIVALENDKVNDASVEDVINTTETTLPSNRDELIATVIPESSTHREIAELEESPILELATPGLETPLDTGGGFELEYIPDEELSFADPDIEVDNEEYENAASPETRIESDADSIDNDDTLEIETSEIEENHEDLLREELNRKVAELERKLEKLRNELEILTREEQERQEELHNLIEKTEKELDEIAKQIRELDT